MYSATNQVFAAKFVLSAARIRCSLPNCVFTSESGIRCRIVLFVVDQVFTIEFVLSIVNQVFAAELCIP